MHEAVAFLAKISREFLHQKKVFRYRLKKISEMNETEIISACHFYVENHHLHDEWNHFIDEKEKQNLNVVQMLDSIYQSATEISGVQVLTGIFQNARAEQLRNVCEILKSEDKPLIAVLAGFGDEPGILYCICTNSAVAKGADAGAIIRKVSALTEGRGGGSSDRATANIGKTELISMALNELENIVAEFIK